MRLSNASHSTQWTPVLPHSRLECHPHLRHGHIAELQRFVLLPTRGRGTHGRRLLDHCLDPADRFSFRICYLESSPTQTAMAELLDLAGFQRIGKTLE